MPFFSPLLAATFLRSHDGGANTCLFVSPLLTARATRTGSTTPLGLAGKGQSLPTQGDATLSIELTDELLKVIASGTISGVLAPTGRRDLLGVTPVWDAVGVTFLPEPWLLGIHPASGRAATMTRWNGLFSTYMTCHLWMDRWIPFVLSAHPLHHSWLPEHIR